MNESCLTYEWVMSHVWMRHVSHMNIDTLYWHVIVWHDSLICVTWLIHMWDMTHSCVWHDSLMCVASFFINAQTAIRFSRQSTSHTCDMTHLYVWHDSPICVNWLTHMCDMTHSCMWHDSLICAMFCFINDKTTIRSTQQLSSRMCHVTHSYVWHDSPICVTWLTHVYDTTRSYAWHLLHKWQNEQDSAAQSNWHVTCVTWLTHMCDMTHPHVWHDSPICITFHFINDKTPIRFTQQLASDLCFMTDVTWLTHKCNITHP